MSNPKPEIAWGWYNFNRLMGVEHRRKDAIATAEHQVGEPWRKAKKYMQVRKVTVEVLEEER